MEKNDRRAVSPVSAGTSSDPSSCESQEPAHSSEVQESASSGASAGPVDAGVFGTVSGRRGEQSEIPRSGAIRIDLHFAVFCIVVKDGIVTEAVPIVKWAIGRPLQVVIDYVERKHGVWEWM